MGPRGTQKCRYFFPETGGGLLRELQLGLNPRPSWPRGRARRAMADLDELLAAAEGLAVDTEPEEAAAAAAVDASATSAVEFDRSHMVSHNFCPTPVRTLQNRREE